MIETKKLQNKLPGIQLAGKKLPGIFGVAIYDYMQQNVEKHSCADCVARDSTSYQNAMKHSSSMIGLYFKGNNADIRNSILGYYPFIDGGARAGIPGADFNRDSIMNPLDDAKKLAPLLPFSPF